MNNNEPQNSEATDWRSLLSPKELAAFEAGKYDDVRTAPKEPSRVSRSKREVPFNPQFKEHQPTHNPELKSHYQQCFEAVDGLACVAATCDICGHIFVEGNFQEPRVTVLEHLGENENRATVYCGGCYNKPESAQQSWRDGLSELHFKAWDLYAAGMNQAEIAEQISKDGQSVSQSTVSRLLKQVKNQRKAGL